MAKGRLPVLRRVWHFLARLDLAAILLLAILALAAVGTCFPQLAPPVASDPDRLARWEEAVHIRYGGLAGVLATVGAFHWFRSPLFLAALALLAFVTFVCTLGRWRAVWRRAFGRSAACPDALFDSARCAARLSPAAPAGGAEVAHLVRERLERRGFRVTANREAGQLGSPQALCLCGSRNALSPLATLVTHLAVLLLAAGALLSGWLGWRETLTLPPAVAVEVGHGSGLALRNEGVAAERYPDGSAAGYEAAVVVLTGRQEAVRGAIRVNAPLVFQGVWFYLRSYEQRPEGAHVTLLAAHDPGYGPVIAAGFLLLLGLTVSFYFPHAWIRARIEPDGALRLAGRADRRAWDFEREFAALVEEIDSR